jgi:hypothetical protein
METRRLAERGALLRQHFGHLARSTAPRSVLQVEPGQVSGSEELGIIGRNMSKSPCAAYKTKDEKEIKFRLELPSQFWSRYSGSGRQNLAEI